MANSGAAIDDKAKNLIIWVKRINNQCLFPYLSRFMFLKSLTSSVTKAPVNNYIPN